MMHEQLSFAAVAAEHLGRPSPRVSAQGVDAGDVLTASGWKPIQDVRAGDLVQSIDPSGHMTPKPVERTFSGPADSLIRVSKRTLYVSITPGHRIAHQRPGSPTHRITPWNELTAWGPGRHGNLAKRLRQMRAAAGLSQSQFQASIGWPAHSKISRIENGKQAPTADEIRAWAEACDRPDAAQELLDLLEPQKSVRIVRAPDSYSADGRIEAPFGWGADDYLAFLGLFLAEGSTNTAVRGFNHKTVITQCTEANQPAIKDLLCRLTLPQAGSIRILPSGKPNVRYYDEGARGGPRLPSGYYPGRPRSCKTFATMQEAEDFLASVCTRVPVKWNLSANGDFQISRKEIWQHFRQFGKAHEKFVPRAILEHANPEQLRTLFDWMVFGDGSVNGTSVSYFTSSPQLADDVAEIALKLGYMVQMSSKDDGHPAHRTRYIVYCNGECRGTLVERERHGRREVSAVPFTGDVYSIRVRDNGNFILRQNGRAWISGDSGPAVPALAAA